MGRTPLAWVPWAKKALAGVQHAKPCLFVMFIVHVSELAVPSIKRPASQPACCILARCLLLHCRLRIQAQQQKQKLTAKSQKKFGKRLYGSAGGTATSGLSSSLAFTPVQVSINQSCKTAYGANTAKSSAASEHQQVAQLVAVRSFCAFSCYVRFPAMLSPPVTCNNLIWYKLLLSVHDRRGVTELLRMYRRSQHMSLRRKRCGSLHCNHLPLHMQGIELTNPLLQAQQEDAQRSGTESYFSDYSGFRSIKGK